MRMVYVSMITQRGLLRAKRLGYALKRITYTSDFPDTEGDAKPLLHLPLFAAIIRGNVEE
jgi:hypothetical protein